MSLRFAIVGCGAIGLRHAELINRFGVLGAVCDIDHQRADELARSFNANACYSIESLLTADPANVVVVCTPNGLHPLHCVQALEAGRHVLCEKPLAIKVKDGQSMIDAALLSERRLFVVKQNRFNPPVIAIKKLLDEGKLGAVHSFQINCFWNRPGEYYRNSWRGTLRLDGGTLFTQFSHFIDLLQWFLGDMRSTTGWRANFQHTDDIEFEDTGVASIMMANGAVGTIHYTINAHPSNMEGSITLFGEKGTVKIGGQYLNRLDYFAVEGEQMPVVVNGGGANDYGHYQGSMSNHHLVYDSLVRALEEPDYPALEAAEALKSVDIIERIYAGSPLITPGR